MRYRHMLILATSMAFTLPAAAQWPTGARTHFVAECMENSQANHQAERAKVFCECAADAASEEFSEAELQQMSQGIDRQLEQRLVETAQRCAGALEG